MSRAADAREARRARPAEQARAPRFLPKRRALRVLVYLALTLAYASVMWFVVFPWVDRTFVSRPAL